MKPTLKQWVSLPSTWIEVGGLKKLAWTNDGKRADGIAALMLLLPIAHLSNEVGISRCTYDQMALATGLSRSKISDGLSVLVELNIVERAQIGRSMIQLTNYGIPGGWSKLPARGLYTSDGRIEAFEWLKLRSRSELNALKLYYLFARRRSNETNMAHLSYDSIEEYSGVSRPDIRTGISLLASLGLVHVEHLQSKADLRATANAYRLAHLDSYIHLGTRGRITDAYLENSQLNAGDADPKMPVRSL